MTKNPPVVAGFTPQSVVWAFTQYHSGNWHPLTWMSHMLDYQLFGANPKGHHLVNLLFHLLNVLLLFLVLKRGTGALWQSAFVAALFAVHPLHVESVAWVSERKDVLSSFFWILTMGAYFRYAKSKSIQSYMIVIGFFVLGLMSKPMLVTLPFVLLLLDYWPLNRFKPSYLPLIKEKIPLFVLMVISCVITTQAQGQAVGDMESYPIGVRVGNALVSFMVYLGKMVWPTNLAIFYPHPKDSVSVALAVVAIVVLLGISLFVFKKVRQSPYLVVGWLWFLGTLVPVIGLVQVGLQARADRYTYIPYIGLFIMVVWGLSQLTSRWRFQKTLLSCAASLVLLVLVFVSWIQAGYWQDSIILSRHALSVTQGNYVAHTNLANALEEKEKNEEAVIEYHQALKINPQFVPAHYNLGYTLEKMGKRKEAMERYYQAILFNPNHVNSHLNLGIVLHRENKIAEAMGHYYEVLRINSQHPKAYYNLGIAYEDKGDYQEALLHYAQALKIKPDYEKAQNNYILLKRKLDEAKKEKVPVQKEQSPVRNANALAMQGKYDEAIKQYQEALRLDPENLDAILNMGNVYLIQGKIKKAISNYEHVVELSPDKIEAHLNLANAYSKKNDVKKVKKHYYEALRINPNHEDSHFYLGNIFSKENNIDQAKYHYEEVLRINPNNVSARLRLDILKKRQLR